MSKRQVMAQKVETDSVGFVEDETYEAYVDLHSGLQARALGGTPVEAEDRLVLGLRAIGAKVRWQRPDGDPEVDGDEGRGDLLVQHDFSVFDEETDGNTAAARRAV